ncbi:MAG TPA: M48 family metalloprotease [Candidatus Saccharimonadales bacterium]|nr:M48 family metalloprotease [Candidatus Saccharimonadales bacterium]
MFNFRFKALAICCFALSFFFSLFGSEQHDRLVKDQFPGAQLWFEKMSQKYPVAQLDNVLFCVSDNYLSRTNVIYWPETRLHAINEAYTHKNHQDLENMFKQDEYLLLHEAAHILKNHMQKGYLALILTCTALATFNSYIAEKVCNNDFTILNTIEYFMHGLVGNIIIFAVLAQYVQLQEQQADDFANEYGDERSLQAGADWFADLEKCMLEDQQHAELIKQLIIIAKDPWHPSPQSRHQKVITALNNQKTSLI